jgi:DNA topoisomerase-1
MGDILLIVESPTKQKKIQDYLGKGWIVRASKGHIMDLAKNDAKIRLGVDVKNGFKPKYNLLPEKKTALQAIIEASELVEKIYIATDPDREGEAIAFHLKDCLESTGKPIFRVKFNAITKDAIKKAVENPGPLDVNLYDAQQARRVLDRIVGFLASETIKKYLGDGLSAGRVQSVAAKLIVDRDQEIESFNPDEYWNIYTALSLNNDSNCKIITKYCKKITNENDAKRIKLDIDNDSFIIKSVEAKEKKRPPLPPLTTPDLQKAAYARYGFGVSKTMKLAQSLYENGFITYMRTDSYRVDPDAIKSVRDYLKNQNLDIPDTQNQYASKGATQDAHEAIRPTDVKLHPNNIFVSDDEQNVYRVIWERFVASQMKPAIYDTVSIIIESSSNHQLKANGRILKYSGWLEITKDFENSKNDEDDIHLPQVDVGNVLELTKPGCYLEQKFTQPPSRYTEASLVDELKKRGIGRPSTYAAIIDKIKGRNYVELIGKSYQSTEVGQNVINNLTKYFSFMDYNYTAQMEDNLDKIEEGSLTYVNMLNEFFDKFKRECRKAEKEEAIDFGLKCQKCNERLYVRHGKYGFYALCIDDFCGYHTSIDWVDGKPVPRDDRNPEFIDGLECPICKSEMFRRDGRYGPFICCKNYPECKGTRKIPCGKECPICGKDLYHTTYFGKNVLFCTGYPSCTYSEEADVKTLKNWVDPESLRIELYRKPIRQILGNKSSDSRRKNKKPRKTKKTQQKDDN